MTFQKIQNCDDELFYGCQGLSVWKEFDYKKIAQDSWQGVEGDRIALCFFLNFNFIEVYNKIVN